MLIQTIFLSLWLTTAAEPSTGISSPQPIPDSFEINTIVTTPEVDQEILLANRRRTLQLRQQVRALRYKHFSSNASEALQAQGIEQIQRMSDPLALAPLAEELAHCLPNVQEALIEHLANQGIPGQIELARIAVYGDDATFDELAALELTEPAPPPVIAILEEALRSEAHQPANVAAYLAHTLNITELIPLLITSQVITSGNQNAGTPSAGGRGDIAQIAIVTQTAYISGLIPVIGDNAGAFQPVVSVLNEGVVMRVLDAVVIEYRTVVNDSLIAMTGSLPGIEAPQCEWNLPCWQAWYNDIYLPASTIHTSSGLSNISTSP
ncbi:MAG: hypothetical protein P8J86_02840 [Phycisphaerales bacterium]|nr:hypothetical protein [Phycisphaerales bacterium]